MRGEEKEHRGTENIVCVLEMLEPRQLGKIQDILRMLYELCDR